MSFCDSFLLRCFASLFSSTSFSVILFISMSFRVYLACLFVSFLSFLCLFLSLALAQFAFALCLFSHFIFQFLFCFSLIYGFRAQSAFYYLHFFSTRVKNTREKLFRFSRWIFGFCLLFAFFSRCLVHLTSERMNLLIKAHFVSSTTNVATNNSHVRK